MFITMFTRALTCAACGAGITAGGAEGLDQRGCALDHRGIAGEDEVEGALARLGDARGHASLDGSGSGCLRRGFDLEVHRR
jgi:hypothetical protein